jgi:hypothetical protein
LPPLPSLQEFDDFECDDQPAPDNALDAERQLLTDLAASQRSNAQLQPSAAWAHLDAAAFTSWLACTLARDVDS